MTYNTVNDATDQRHLLNLERGFGPAGDTKPYKVIKKLSGDDREIISDMLKTLISAGEIEPTQTAIAKTANIHVTEVNKLLSRDPARRKLVSVPGITKLINAVKMIIPNRPDLSFPLIYGREECERKGKTKKESRSGKAESKPAEQPIAEVKNRFSDNDRKLISKRLVKHLHSVFGFTPTSLAKKASVNVMHISWLITDNVKDKDRPICPDTDIVKIVNTARLKINGRPDLSWPLQDTPEYDTKPGIKPDELYVTTGHSFPLPDILESNTKPKTEPDKPYASLTDKILESDMPIEAIDQSGTDKVNTPEDKFIQPREVSPGYTPKHNSFKHEVPLIMPKNVPDLIPTEPDLPGRIQQIIDQLRQDLKTEEALKASAAFRFAESMTEKDRHEYFLRKAIIRKILQQIILLEKVLK